MVSCNNTKNSIYKRTIRSIGYSNIYDGDIVVEDSRFITYCYEKLTKNKDLDMLAQCEWKGKNMTDEICSGFLAIKSNARTKKNVRHRYVHKLP